LEDGFPEPDQEGLGREGAALLEGLVEGRELHDGLNGDILVENQRERGKICVDGAVAKHEESVVHGDGDKVENDREYCLNN
jgi:hypothetical protein